METYKSRFIEFLLECGALKFGEFRLKSGRSSPFFINLGEIDSGRRFEALGEFLAQALASGFPNATSLFGPAYKGIPLATAAAMGAWKVGSKDLGVFYDRKEAKEHGEGGTFIGRAPTPQDTVVIIDDVMTDGATKLEAIKAIEKRFQVTPAGVLVTVDRTFKGARPPFRLGSIVTLPEIVSFLRASQDGRADLINDYWEKGS